MRVRFAALVCLLSVVGVATAQQGTLSISIERGRLRVDGHRVADAYVPSTLDLQRVEGYASYSGPRDASVEIGGLRYRVRGGRIVIDTDPTGPPDVVLQAGHPLDLGSGGYVFVPVDWISDPAEVQRFHFATQQEIALDATAEAYADQIRRLDSTDPQHARAVERLRACLEDAFEVKQRNRLREIEMLEAELRFLRKQQQRRTQHRDEIVSRRLRELLAQ